MEYRRIGKSGLQVSALSFGAWVTFGTQVDVDLAVDLMKTAYDAGVNFFDNAEVYAYGEAEIVMGKALKKLGWRRDSYLVSSKVMFGCLEERKPTQWGLHRKHVIEACDQALGRLGVECLDLYFCHRPDPETPIEETVRAMTDLIRMGKVHYWGTSEWSAQQLMEAYGIARQYNLVPPTMEQPQYNMFHRQRFEVEYARLYDVIGLGTTIWSPLSWGILTGKYSEGILDDTRVKLEGYEWLREFIEGEEGQQRVAKTKELVKVAEKLETSMAKLAIAWCLKNPNVSTVILGASRVDQLEENLDALEVLELLTDDVMDEIEEILDNKPERMEFQLERR
ncbi:MAG: voltage-dependent potassium channel subunit beta [Anaerolineales bacterium]|nr:voltage-dependent potassium channel subunit beta [Anaerolineales bacterium]